MVDAGRILIMPKGIWSNLVSYEMLDVVTQDNIAYLARQSSVGVSPKNDSSYTYWQPFGTSVTPDGETIIMNSAGNITANIDNKSLIYDDVNMYVKVAIDGSTIKYDNSNGYLYVDASNFNINDLNNIAITSPANGQVLVYDSTTQKWKNGQGSVSPIDNLTSNSTTQPLSANQGRVLNNQKLEKEIISDAWNASTTYAVGQYCIYNNLLWKCLIQHSGQTPTEGTYWTKVSVANEITSVNNSIPKRTLLWSNPSLTSMEENYEINLSSVDYDELEFFVPNIGIFRTMKGNTVVLNFASVSADGAFCSRRIINYTSDTLYKSSYGATAQGTTSYKKNANILVPTHIYGIKY